MEELVSAIITTHKRPADIVKRAVLSVINQNYKNIEIIVVDDSPKEFIEREDVKRAVLSLSKEIKYIQHEKTYGACAARNSGTAVSSGTYIAFLDDDDEWLPEKIEEEIKVMREDVALVYCKSFSVYDGDYSKKRIREAPQYRGFVFDKMLESNFIGSTSFPLIRKQCLLDVGGFDTNMKSAQDYDLWTRISKKYKIDFVEKPLVYYHYHTIGQITKKPNNAIAGLERYWEKNKDEILKNRHAYYCRCMEIAPYYARIGNRTKAVSVWISAVFKEPKKMLNSLKKLKLIMSLKDNSEA